MAKNTKNENKVVAGEMSEAERAIAIAEGISKRGLTYAISHGFQTIQRNNGTLLRDSLRKTADRKLAKKLDFVADSVADSEMEAACTMLGVKVPAPETTPEVTTPDAKPATTGEVAKS